MTAIRRAVVALALLALPAHAFAQGRTPGRPIGKVSMIGNVIHLELNPGVVTPARLFDLDRRTLRFTPASGGYRVENVELQWDDDFGQQLNGGTYTLRNFRFPFSGRNWQTMNIANGAITFGEPVAAGAPAAGARRAGGGGRGGAGGGGGRAGGGPRGGGRGFQMERYARMRTVGATFINMVPGIAAWVKTNWNGERYVKELSDRLVVTWTLSEPAGGIQAFSWTPTMNRIQAVLHGDGRIELSWNGIHARDGVVGVFPTVSGGAQRTLGSLTDATETSVAGHLDITSVRLSATDELFVQATIETRGPIPQGATAPAEGMTYRIALDRESVPADLGDADVVWTIRSTMGGRGVAAGLRYAASGAGLQPQVTVEGRTITVSGILPGALSGAARVSVAADAGQATPTAIADRVDAAQIALQGVQSPEADFSAGSFSSPFPVVYEGFHWSESPRAQDVACSIITTFGDKFDFIASYSDFRVDDPEGGTPSTGPRGGNVTGIGNRQGDLGAFCSQGRLQFMFAQPVSTSAVQIQERSPDGRMRDYNYAVSQIAHELGHRWAASASAIINGERVPLGPTHWQAGVHLPAAFPYGRPYEADIMGGSTWQENPDGTFTQLDRDYYNPAKGFSWLALYLMGLARPEEVPPFFILRNLERTGQTDAEGRPIFRGEKVTIRIEDVIAAEGPRQPPFEQSQKEFNTAIVVITEPGKQPTQELLMHAHNIGQKYVEYWAKTTGGRSRMTINAM